MNERLATLATIEPYIGKYYSNDFVRRKILRQTDSEIIEIDDQIEQEIKDGAPAEYKLPIAFASANFFA